LNSYQSMKTTKSFSTALSLLLALNSTIASAVSQPPSKSPLFNQDSVVQLELAADFVKIRKVADGGFWGQDDVSDDLKYFTEMVLRDPAHPDRVFKGLVRARGMSSLTEGEAEFPKLKLKIDDKEEIKGTLFQSSRNFRINTHLSTNPISERTGMGRVLGDNGPYREGLAYKVAEAIGIQTPATRLARIRYMDYGTNTNFTRSGLLIESSKKTAERLGGTEIFDYEQAEFETSNIDPVEGALFHIYQKLIGNDDYNMRVNEPARMTTESYRAIFNAMVIELPSKKRIPVVYDLDMSTFVGGYEVLNKDFPAAKEFKFTSFQQSTLALKFSALRQKFTRPQLEKAIAIIKSKKDLLYQTVQNNPVDKEGRQNAVLHLDTFFANIDMIMNLQVITQEGALIFADAQKKKNLLKDNQIMDEPGTLRPGTPVVVIGKEGKMLKVAILDSTYDLQDAKKTIGYIEATTKIGLTIPDDLIGVIDDRDMSFGGGA
jgi:hypothetical protein